MSKEIICPECSQRAGEVQYHATDMPKVNGLNGRIVANGVRMGATLKVFHVTCGKCGAEFEFKAE